MYKGEHNMAFEQYVISMRQLYNRTTACIGWLQLELSAYIEENICFTLSDRLLRTSCYCAVVEMIPGVVMGSIRCVMSWTSTVKQKRDTSKWNRYQPRPVHDVYKWQFSVVSFSTMSMNQVLSCSMAVHSILQQHWGWPMQCSIAYK